MEIISIAKLAYICLLWLLNNPRETRNMYYHLVTCDEVTYALQHTDNAAEEQDSSSNSLPITSRAIFRVVLIWGAPIIIKPNMR